jgi:hypothetical protein
MHDIKHLEATATYLATIINYARKNFITLTQAKFYVTKVAFLQHLS